MSNVNNNNNNAVPCVAITEVVPAGNGNAVECYKYFVTSDFRTGKFGVGTAVNLLGFSSQCRCANFVVSGNANSASVTPIGNFDRLKDKNGISPLVLLAEYVSPQGRILGYVVVDKYGRVSRVRKQELLDSCKQAKTREVALIQNAIYRETNGVAQLAAYPGAEFWQIVQQQKKRMPAAQKVVPKQEDIKAVKKVLEQAEKPQPPKKEVPAKEPVKKAPDKKAPEKAFSDSQKKELIAAKKAGIDPMIISSPKLSPEQMRVIWVANKNGVETGYFADPKFSVEQMQFFADRLVNKELANECRSIIDPKFDVDQLAELYQGIASGIDYTSYADEKLLAEEMYVKRAELECSTYSSLLIDHGGHNSNSTGRHFINKLRQSNGESTGNNQNGDKK